MRLNWHLLFLTRQLNSQHLHTHTHHHRRTDRVYENECPFAQPFAQQQNAKFVLDCKFRLLLSANEEKSVEPVDSRWMKHNVVDGRHCRCHRRRCSSLALANAVVSRIYSKWIVIICICKGRIVWANVYMVWTAYRQPSSILAALAYVHIYCRGVRTGKHSPNCCDHWFIDSLIGQYRHTATTTPVTLEQTNVKGLNSDSMVVLPLLKLQLECVHRKNVVAFFQCTFLMISSFARRKRSDDKC